MPHLLLRVRDLWRTKRFLLAAILILVVGIVPVSVAIVHASQSQIHADTDATSDHEALRSNPLSSSGSCGVERWAVKTGTDADVGLINLQSTTPTTIASLTSLPAPSTLPSNNRIQPTETTVFQLQDTLTEYKLESDSDYHLILADGTGKTMIVEIPDPACVGSSSPLLSDIQTARSEFDARYTPTTSFQTANVPVTVTGVGFFDFLHGQTGVAPNGIELHAVLAIQFGTDGTPTPTATATSTPIPTPPGSTPTPTSTPIASVGIVNGGFETGNLSGWTLSGVPPTISSVAHSGTYSAQIGTKSGQQGDSILLQMVTIPNSATSATLSLYYWPATNDSSTYAWQEADLLNSSGQVMQQLFKKTSNTRAWTAFTANLSSYTGQTIGIRFLDHENSNGLSYYAYMYVDDVTLTTH